MELDIEKIIDDTLKASDFKSILKSVLAEKIASQYHFKDSEGILLKEEVRELIKEEAKIAIKELRDSYFELKDIEDMIKDSLRSFTRNQIIELLKQ